MDLKEYTRDIKGDIARANGKIEKLLFALTNMEVLDEQGKVCVALLEKVEDKLTRATKEIDDFRED